MYQDGDHYRVTLHVYTMWQAEPFCCCTWKMTVSREFVSDQESLAQPNQYDYDLYSPPVGRPRHGKQQLPGNLIHNACFYYDTVVI